MFMIQDQFTTLFLYWIVYSLFGWILETIYCSFLQGHYVERGFLNGPFCPIYGFGALLVLTALDPYIDNIAAVFILGMCFTSILEYITSYIMEKLFKMRWWDYSDHKFNINGRVCLLNSVLFGILCVLLIEWIHPGIVFLINEIPITIKYVSTIILFVIISADLFVSVRSVQKLNHKFEQIHELKEQLREKLEQESLTIKENLHEIRASFLENKLNDLKEFKENLSGLKDRIDIVDKIELSLHERIRTLQTENKYCERRLLRAFPRLKSKKHNDILQEIKKVIKEFAEERTRRP